MRDVLLGDPKGKDVFKMLLGFMGFFSESETDESTAVKNCAIRLVQLVGPDDSELLAQAFVNAIDTSYSMESTTVKKENIK